MNRYNIYSLYLTTIQITMGFYIFDIELNTTIEFKTTQKHYIYECRNNDTYQPCKVQIITLEFKQYKKKYNE